MTSVYDIDNFKGRVNLAASYIASNRGSTRTFDTCFEMYDGDVVVVALARRAAANPTGRLAQNLFTRLSEDRTTAHLEKFSATPTRDLPAVAAEMRRKAKEEFESWLATKDAAT